MRTQLFLFFYIVVILECHVNGSFGIGILQLTTGNANRANLNVHRVFLQMHWAACLYGQSAIISNVGVSCSV